MICQLKDREKTIKIRQISFHKMDSVGFEPFYKVGPVILDLKSIKILLLKNRFNWL